MSDPAARARVIGALRGLAGDPCICTSTDEVRARLRLGAVRALVLEPRDQEGASTAPMVSEIHRDHPSVSILVYLTPGRTPSSEAATLLRIGAHQLVLHGIDDERNTLRAAFLAAEHVTVADLVLDIIADELPPGVRPLVELYLRGTDGTLSLDAAARQLGVHRRTLQNRMDSAGYPGPGELRGWCRLFIAAQLMHDGGRTVEGVAQQLDFPSASALRNLLKRRTGLAPHGLRAAGGLRYLLRTFQQSCERRRTRDVAPATCETIALLPAHPEQARVAESPCDDAPTPDRREQAPPVRADMADTSSSSEASLAAPSTVSSTMILQASPHGDDPREAEPKQAVNGAGPRPAHHAAPQATTMDERPRLTNAPHPRRQPPRSTSPPATSAHEEPPQLHA